MAITPIPKKLADTYLPQPIFIHLKIPHKIILSPTFSTYALRLFLYTLSCHLCASKTPLCVVTFTLCARFRLRATLFYPCATLLTLCVRFYLCATLFYPCTTLLTLCARFYLCATLSPLCAILLALCAKPT